MRKPIAAAMIRTVTAGLTATNPSDVSPCKPTTYGAEAAPRA